MKATRTRMTARRKKKSLPSPPPASTDLETRLPPVFDIRDERRRPAADASMQDALEDWPESEDAPDEWMVERDEQQRDAE